MKVAGVVRAPVPTRHKRRVLRAIVAWVLRREASPWGPRMAWRDRARWTWARALDRSLSRTCWSDLVQWEMSSAEDQREPATRIPFRDVFGTDTCRRDAFKTGACYCGKFRREGEAS